MKAKKQKNIRKILSTSTKSQAELNKILINLSPSHLSKEDKKTIHIQLDQLEQMALAIKAKL